MSLSTITLPDGTVVTLVPLPASPAPKMVEPWAFDSVASIGFPFSGNTQQQGTPGADRWGMTVTWPPAYLSAMNPILAWLLGMQGMLNVVQLAPPEFVANAGSCAGTPVIATAAAAAVSSISTSGWTASAAGVLLPMDCIQIGYRLHRVLDTVNADSSGHATFRIWPSLRDPVTVSEAIVTANPLGLFQLASNKRNWSVQGPKRETDLSVQLVEFRGSSQ